MVGWNDLNDIVDSFDQTLLEPIEAMPETEDRQAVPGQNVYACLTVAITAHFNPHAYVEFQRYLFKRTLQDTPNIDDFYYTLKQLVETCQYAQPNAEIKSQIIMGCRLDKVHDKGLRDPDVTLDQLLQYARNLEVTYAHSQMIKSQTVNTVHKAKQQLTTKRHPAKHQTKKHTFNQPEPATCNKNCKNKCRNCGGQWPHQGGHTCHSCGKQNHFTAVCLSKPRVNNIEIEDDVEYTYKLNMKSQVSSPYFKVKVDDSYITIMADSGASVNILSEKDYLSMKHPP
ncbi:uncharacterized protein LOC106156635 [Lingula anatina]|uniref:Uncharacterized protein LOC106156635 n=1 Tax=Lingula anatina TaxID=7574 RepID=A0A1S3HQW4_LINAN|nr:uncharacterized protein LOC106156635 [Lingula anatina]|eukprot:XP_013387429.1 uncharacterized protein LOC106156635 [Lingula anatina]